jgi:hypothetical protein
VIYELDMMKNLNKRKSQAFDCQWDLIHRFQIQGLFWDQNLNGEMRTILEKISDTLNQEVER